MNQSPEIAKLAKALCDFQHDMENVTKDATNPFFKSKYATLEAIITSAKPHLKKHGLAFSQFPEGDGLTTTLMHTSGEYLSATCNMAHKEKPQEQGSAITYMRRYALSSVLGIATEDDDDGNEASKPSQTVKTAPQRTEAPKPSRDAEKKLIGSLMTKLGQPITKENAAEKVEKVTRLALTEENFPEIIRTLEALIDEKNNDQ